MIKYLKIGLIFLIVLTIFACMSKPEFENPVGENVIPTDKLELIIYDIHLADAIITSKIMKTNNNSYVDSMMYVSIFEKHNYSREDFENTILFYVHNNLDSLDSIYVRVINRFNIEQGKIY